MPRVFITGDTHHKEEYHKVERLCDIAGTTKDDILIVCGDHGVLYHGPSKDRIMKRYLESLPITFVLVHGNHCQRPSKKLCKEVTVVGSALSGEFLIEPDYPSLWYPKMYGQYSIFGKPAYIMGGAYSVDKYFRLDMQALGHKNWRWFADEQLSEREQKKAYAEMKAAQTEFEYIITHTCPLRYVPYDKLVPGYDQSKVDKTMENFFGDVEETIPYKLWICGHYHVDRVTTDRKVRFMYNDVIELRNTEGAEQ